MLEHKSLLTKHNRHSKVLMVPNMFSAEEASFEQQQIDPFINTLLQKQSKPVHQKVTWHSLVGQYCQQS